MSSSDFTPLADGTHHRKRVAFDPTINLGHVLTFVGFLVTGVALGVGVAVTGASSPVPPCVSELSVRADESLVGRGGARAPPAIVTTKAAASRIAPNFRPLGRRNHDPRPVAST